MPKLMDMLNPCPGFLQVTFFLSLLLYLIPASETHPQPFPHPLIPSVLSLWRVNTITTNPSLGRGRGASEDGEQGIDCFWMLRRKHQSQWGILDTDSW